MKNLNKEKLIKDLSKQVWNNVQPKVQKQCEDAFKEFENMFEKKSFNLGYNKAQKETQEKVKKLKEAFIKSWGSEHCDYIFNIINKIFGE